MATYDFYLIRHGETIANQSNLVCGQFDSPLSEKGRAQAIRLRESTLGVQFNDFQAFVSPLSRAIETATLSFPDIQFERAPELMETNTGHHSEMNLDEFHSLYPEFKHLGKCVNTPFPGGESIAQVYARMSRWFDRLVADQQGGRYLIVGHGGTTNCFLHWLLKTPLELYPAFKIQNATLTHARLDSQSGAVELISLNQTSI